MRFGESGQTIGKSDSIKRAKKITDHYGYKIHEVSAKTGVKV